jgi:hypothetical protein
MNTPVRPDTTLERRPHPASFGAGVFFTIVGVVFVLEQLDVLRLEVGALWPLLLIALGLALAAEEAAAWLARGRER